MRFKKGFTLAEILIVLMVIGAIATMTIPSLLKGVYQSQWKTGYKKAFNVIKNMYAAEKTSGASIATSSTTSLMTLFDMMYVNITSSGFAEPFTYEEIVNGRSISPNEFHGTIGYEVNGKVVTGEYTANNVSETSPWIISDDNIAYAVIRGDECKRTIDIDSETTFDGVKKKSCLVVVADVNGLQNSPNFVDTQSLANNQTTPQITGERFFIYIGSDGVTAGPRKYTITGRIASDT